MEARLQVQALINRYNERDNHAATWKQQWQDIKDLVRINAKDFYGQKTPGEAVVQSIYDGTAIWALEQLAAALQRYLTSPSSRWFTLSLEDPNFLTLEEKQYLEAVTNIIYKEYTRPKVNFNSIMHENYLDLCSMGTSIVYQTYNTKNEHLQFKTFPLADCRLMENDQEIVDLLDRKVCWSSRQVAARFGAVELARTAPKLWEEISKDAVDAKKHNILHCVFPRTERNFKKLTKVNKAWASIWISLDKKELLNESGFDQFPYHVPRWSKISGEDYGRSPAMTCLPDIKMLNVMDKTLIKASQKMVDPPLLMPDDGFMMPLRTAPGSISYYESGTTDAVIPLETKGKFPIGEAMIERKQQRIIKSFFVDWIIREKKRERQTVTEIADDRNEMLGQMAPMLGRLQNELLGPMITRSYHLLKKARRIPVPPKTLEGRVLTIEYTSPAAKAQKSEKGISIQQFLAGVTQMAQIDPSAVDIVDTDRMVMELADISDVPSSGLRSPEAIAEMRQQRQQQQQQQQQMLLAEQGAGAMKDLAIANEKGGIV